MVAAHRAVNLEAAPQEFVAARDPNLGPLEAEVRRPTRELPRRTGEAAAQAKANAPRPAARPAISR